MRAIGANSPASAVPPSRLPDQVRERMDWYVNAGLVREGAPGTFYLYEPVQPRITARMVVPIVLFWILVILIPVAVIQFTGSRAAPRSSGPPPIKVETPR